MKIFYVTNKKPRSHNKQGSTATYKKELRDEFNAKYSHLYFGLPISDKILQAHIVFIHQLRAGTIPDADNISKPIVDAFSGTIYSDDKLIIRRIADILELKDFDFMTVDATDMPLDIYNDFQNYYIHKSQHIIFYEITEFLPSQIKIGEL